MLLLWLGWWHATWTAPWGTTSRTAAWHSTTGAATHHAIAGDHAGDGEAGYLRSRCICPAFVQSVCDGSGRTAASVDYVGLTVLQGRRGQQHGLVFLGRHEGQDFLPALGLDVDYRPAACIVSKLYITAYWVEVLLGACAMPELPTANR